MKIIDISLPNIHKLQEIESGDVFKFTVHGDAKDVFMRTSNTIFNEMVVCINLLTGHIQEYNWNSSVVIFPDATLTLYETI